MSLAVYYGDSACATTPMVAMIPCDIPTHITELKTNRQGPVRAVGGALSRPSQVYADFGDGRGCQPALAGTTYEFRDASVVVPNAQLVTFTVQREARGSRLAADVLVGSDGSRDARFIADTQRNIHCGPRNRFFFTEQCFPATLAFAYPRFADSSCTQRLGTVPLLPQREPFINDPPGVVVVDFNADPEPLLQEPGPPYAGTSVFQLIGTMCDPYLDLAPGAFVELGGATVPVSAFALFSVVPEGTQRLQVNAVRSESGDLLYREDLMDTQLGNAVCVPAQASDGTTRCMPIQDYGTRFADAACTQYVVARPDGTSPPVAVTQEVYVNECNTTRIPVRVGNPLSSGTVIYADNGLGSCDAVPMDPGTTYYATTVLQPSEMELLQLVTQ